MAKFIFTKSYLLVERRVNRSESAETEKKRASLRELWLPKGGQPCWIHRWRRGEMLERCKPWQGLCLVCHDGEARSQKSESQFSIKCIGMNDHPGNFGGSQKKKDSVINASARKNKRKICLNMDEGK